MKIEGRKIIFSSGRKEYSLDGVMGIDNDLRIQGWDPGFYIPTIDDWDYKYFPKLTLEERIEFADFMIDRWKQFKDRKNAKNEKS